MQTNPNINNDFYQFFLKCLNEADKYLKPYIEKHLPRSFTATSIRILAPGAGLLPSAPVLISALNRVSSIRDVTIVCVDKRSCFGDLKEIYQTYFPQSGFNQLI